MANMPLTQTGTGKLLFQDTKHAQHHVISIGIVCSFGDWDARNGGHGTI
jgi:hypothetical protein